MTKTETRSRVLLAYAICEWDSAITHLTAMQKIGFDVPQGILDQMDEELFGLVSVWTAEQRTTAAVVAAARVYLTSHVRELDSMLAEAR